MVAVYFGLLLAGATPQIQAQTTGSRQSDRKGATEKKISGDKALEQFAVALEDLYRITSELPTEAKRGQESDLTLDYFVTVKPNGVSRQYSPSSDEAIWSAKLREPLRDLYDAFLPRAEDWNENFLVHFSVGKDVVTLQTTIVTDPGSAAQLLSSFELGLLARRSAEGNYIRSQIFQAANVSLDKNKIIVVSNLARAGLDSLLTKSGQ